MGLAVHVLMHVGTACWALLLEMRLSLAFHRCLLPSAPPTRHCAQLLSIKCHVSDRSWV